MTPAAASPPAVVEVDGHRLRLSNLDKVLYPADGTTKAEVIQYYVTVAPALLNQLRDRPVTRVRWPSGTSGESFFEKNVPKGVPSWVPTVVIESRTSRRTAERVEYPLVANLATLVWLANLASLELHVPQWRVDGSGAAARPSAPDRLVVDLDPGAPAGLTECAQVALAAREELTLEGFTAVLPVTSGSKGLQLYASPPPGHPELTGRPGEPADPDAFRRHAQRLAERLARRHPARVVSSMAKPARRGKVLLDWSQNTVSKTTICPYSLRGKSDRAWVAAPRTWQEVSEGADGGEFFQLEPHEVVQRLQRDGDLMTTEADRTGPR